MRIKAKEQLIIDFLSDEHGFYDKPHLSKLKQLFEISVGRLIIKWLRELDREEPVINHRTPSTRYRAQFLSAQGLSDEDIRYVNAGHHLAMSQHSIEIISVVDFIRSSIEDDAPWLKNLDDLGRPKKLMKCGSIQQLLYEHDKYFRIPEITAEYNNRFGNSFKTIQITAADTREYADLGLGYKLVELLTPNALRYEGAIMQHCIGRGGFDVYLDPDRDDVADHILLSLRPPEGNPLATIHLQYSEFGLVIKQFQGFRNGKPEPYMYDLVAPLNWLTRNDYVAALDEKNRKAQSMPDCAG